MRVNTYWSRSQWRVYSPNGTFQDLQVEWFCYNVYWYSQSYNLGLLARHVDVILCLCKAGIIVYITIQFCVVFLLLLLFRQSYNIEITLSNARTRVTTKNTIDLKNAFYRYFGTPPQPPPGVNHESPAEKIAVQVQQLQTAGGNPVSMVNSQLGGTAVPVVTNGQVVLSQNAMMQGGVPMQTVPMSMHSTQSNPNQANHPRAS